MFEVQYTELALAVDEIAERIRALGAPAPGSYAAYAKLTRVKEAVGVPKAAAMVDALADDQDIVAETARRVFPLADKAQDQATADLLTRRLLVHEKNAWTLRSQNA